VHTRKPRAWRARVPTYLSTTVEPDIHYTQADIIERAPSFSLLPSSSHVLSGSEGEIILGGREGEMVKTRRVEGGMVRASSRFYPRLRLSPRLGLHIVPYTRLLFGILRTFGFLTSFARTVSLFFSLRLPLRSPSHLVLCNPPFLASSLSRD